MFNIGDVVIIKNTGKSYTTYKDWFNMRAPDLLSKYKYDEIGSKNNVYRVVAKGEHEYRHRGMLYAIQDYKNRVYLIHEDGIVKTNKRMEI